LIRRITSGSPIRVRMSSGDGVHPSRIAIASSRVRVLFESAKIVAVELKIDLLEAAFRCCFDANSNTKGITR